MTIFDSTSKNKIILYNMVYRVFNEITHRAIIKIFHNENPFFSIPAYNYLYTQNLKKYFDSLLYNYSFHRRYYLDAITQLSTGKEDLNEELYLNINSKEASLEKFQFGFYENFRSTLCNWPNEEQDMELIDTIFSPFYRWEKRVKNNGALNFTQIAIILGELPMKFETLVQFNMDEYKKYMSLVFDINENLFNEILYLYVKTKDKSNLIMYEPKFIMKTELGRIFVNYILFALLINKHAGFKFDEFIHKENNENKNTYIQEIKELLWIIGYDDINQFENDQKIFPYKIVFKIFKSNEDQVTKLLKLIWLKKLYPLVVYSMKKSEKLKNIDYYLPIFGINQETIDFRYFIYNGIQLNEEEIDYYFKILKKFISEELYLSKAEKKYFNELTEKSKDKRKYLYRPYLQNYIELQLYMIVSSLSRLEEIRRIGEDRNLYNKIQDILELYRQNSFYIKKGLEEYDSDDNFSNSFNLYLINEKNKLEKSFIKIYELTIREINVTGNYVRKETELKNYMNKNLLNNRYLFINNKSERQKKALEGKKDEYIKELIRFIFVPLKKEKLPQYLKTAETIYNDFFKE